jgi:hypothetical protein
MAVVAVAEPARAELEVTAHRIRLPEPAQQPAVETVELAEAPSRMRLTAIQLVVAAVLSRQGSLTALAQMAA